jgi:hypothetical protein
MAHAYHLRPTAEIERCLRYTPPPLRDIVFELRSLIQSVAPGVTEEIQRRGFTYFFAERGGPVSAGLCQIGLFPDHIRLAFVHGAFLPDPRGLLEGDRLAKRFVRLADFDHAPWDDLRALLLASAQFDPRSLSPPR